MPRMGVRSNHLQMKIDESAAMVAQRQQLESIFGSPIQREVEPDEEELDSVPQLKAIFDAPIQRDEELEEEEEEAVPQMKAKVAQKQENNTGLPDNLKAGIEHEAGRDMSEVRVHYNSPEPAQLNAHAFTQYPNIHVAPGQEKHVPHEVGHLPQQVEGRVKPTIDVGGVPVNDSSSLEKEADAIGNRAAQVGKELLR